MVENQVKPLANNTDIEANAYADQMIQDNKSPSMPVKQNAMKLKMSSSV